MRCFLGFHRWLLTRQSVGAIRVCKRCRQREGFVSEIQDWMELHDRF